MIGYNYKNLKITTSNHNDLLLQYNNCKNTLNKLEKSIRSKKLFSIGYLRCLTNPYNFFLVKVTQDDILFFRLNVKEGKIYDNIDIKDFINLFQDDSLIEIIITNISNDVKLFDLSLLDNYKSSFYTTEDFNSKEQEDFEL